MDYATLCAVMGRTVPQPYVEPFNLALVQAGCTTVNRVAMFCGQVGEESGGLRWMEELASGAEYEGRKDLGNTQSGDGRRFKGRGPIQLTGRNNYGAFSRWAHAQGLVNSDDYFVANPTLVAEPRWGFLAAAWYWTVARPRLNALADAGDIVGATKAVNGGTNGLADRTARWKRALTFGDRLLPTPGGAVTPPAPTYGNTGVRGLDYSAGTIAGAVIKAAGFSFVVRYVDSPAVGLSRKHITPDEYRELTSAGVDVYLVHEVATTDMLGGHDAGVAHARRARAGADWIGYPSGAPIFMACDMHLTAAQLPAALAYVDGAVSVLGDACGVYGFWELVDTCIAQRKGSWFWQAGVSPDPTDPVHLWQRNDKTTVVGGIACDINELRIPLEDDMTPDQDARLTRIEQAIRLIWEQLAGFGADPFDDAKRYTGWPAFDGGTPGNRTLVDIGRQADVDLAALRVPKQP